MTAGELLIRGAEDPHVLANPTRITGTNDDGTLTDVALTTPTVHFTRDVPEFDTTAVIDAAFSMVGPGTGSVNSEGHMTVNLTVAVDLHVVVGILPDPRDCRAAPVNLTLTSISPYDPETEQVTVAAPNFSVPSVVQTDDCTLVVDPINDALAGPGHSISLTLEGPLTLPTLGAPTSTTLAVAPSDGAHAGDDITLTASVVPAPPIPGAPPITGDVVFSDGDTQLGAAPVAADGTAALTTTLLPGHRELRAQYSGVAPHWDPSSSDVTDYRVTADPAVTTDAAGEIAAGGAPKDFSVTVVNTGFGTDIEDARLEIDIRRQRGDGDIGPNGPTPRITLDRVPEGATTPMPLTFSGGFPQRLNGEITSLDIPVGEDLVEDLRLEVANGTSFGPLALTFTLVSGEGTDEVELAETTGVVTIVHAARTPTTVVSGDPGFPDFGIPEVPAVTPIVRQGNVAELLPLRVEPVVGAVFPTGTYRFAVDGRPVQGQHIDATVPNRYTWLDKVPISPGGGGTFLVKLPADLAIGTRMVTVQYSGDAQYAPSQAGWPITVEPSIGDVYECASQGFVGERFTANVEVQASLPGVWATGRDLPVSRAEVRMRLSRTTRQQEVLTNLFDGEQSSRMLALDLSPDGTLTPSDVSRTDHTAFTPGDGLGIDSIVHLTGGAGSLAVGHAPGTTLDYTLDTITVTSAPGGFLGGIICTPEGRPADVGSVTAAGTVLTADPAGPVGQGSDVELTAKALPAAPGVVEFRDGAETIGLVPVDGFGVARMTTDDLPAGTRSLTARFFGGPVGTLPSAPVALRVASCGGAAEPGSGAVVRLVYLELLGRCPDARGYDYWVDRLDGGTTLEAFARSIARTSEAVGRVVDDAYVAMLGRPADPGGRVFWTGRLQASGRYDQLLADLAASGEFWARAGSSNGGVVTRIYEQLLDRSPDQGGFDHWVARLASGTSRRALVLVLANLAEPLSVLVGGAYDEILDRAPTAVERTDGVALLRSTGDRSGLYARLIGTEEFHDRAQGLPDPA